MRRLRRLGFAAAVAVAAVLAPTVLTWLADEGGWMRFSAAVTILLVGSVVLHKHGALDDDEGDR